MWNKVINNLKMIIQGTIHICTKWFLDIVYNINLISYQLLLMMTEQVVHSRPM